MLTYRVLVTSPDFPRADDLRSGSGRSVGACGGGIRGGDRVWPARSDGRSGTDASRSVIAVPRNASGRNGDALPGDARRAHQQVRVGGPCAVALSAVDRVLDLNHRSRLD